jgi:Flp pilus assembly CpaE family ATPase
MGQLSVVALGPNQESCEALKSALQSTGLVEKIIRLTYPVGDEWLRDLAGIGVTVVTVDVPPQDPSAGLEAIARVHEYLPGARVIAFGDSRGARTIVEAMRAGASDFLDYSHQAGELSRALLYKVAKQQSRGKIFSFINAKGGSGATTLAVNTALTLMDFSERVALVDLATPGNASLHLNLTPKYTLKDVTSNLHRMDMVLLEQLMAKHASGLDVLPGADEPIENPALDRLAFLFDLLASTYEFVVVDASSRLDEITRKVCDFSDAVLMIAQTDLASLWNAQRVRKYLARDTNPELIRLVLNRYKKVPGVTDKDMEQASGCKLAWSFPNQFVSVTNAITIGTPVTQTDCDLTPAFASFVEFLTGRSRLRSRRDEKRGGSSIRERLSGLKAIAPIGIKASESA